MVVSPANANHYIPSHPDFSESYQHHTSPKGPPVLTKRARRRWNKSEGRIVPGTALEPTISRTLDRRTSHWASRSTGRESTQRQLLINKVLALPELKTFADESLVHAWDNGGTERFKSAPNHVANILDVR